MGHAHSSPTRARMPLIVALDLVPKIMMIGLALRALVDGGPPCHDIGYWVGWLLVPGLLIWGIVRGELVVWWLSRLGYYAFALLCTMHVIVEVTEGQAIINLIPLIALGFLAASLFLGLGTPAARRHFGLSCGACDG